MRVEIKSYKIVADNIYKVKDGIYDLTPFSKKRSNALNKYLHGYLFPTAAKRMSEMTGKKVTAEMAKAILKYKCATEFNEDIGTYILPTSKMPNVRCVKFIEDCWVYGAEVLEFYFEEPGENEWRLIKEGK